MNTKTGKIIKSIAVVGGVTAVGVAVTPGQRVQAATTDQANVQLTPQAQQVQAAKQSAAAAENKMAAENSVADAQDVQTAKSQINELTEKQAAAVNQENQTLTQAADQANNQASQAVVQENQNYLSNVDAARSAASTAISAVQSSAAKLTNSANTAIDQAKTTYDSTASAAVSDANAQNSAAAAEYQANTNQLTSVANEDEAKAASDHQVKINNQKAVSQKLIDRAQAAVDAAKKGTIKKLAPAQPLTTFAGNLTNYGKSQQARAKQDQSLPEAINVVNAFGAIIGTLSKNTGSDFEFFTNNANAASVSSEGQLPLDFKPGLILYDAANDHSEKIGDQLTIEQAHHLSELTTYWLNQLRHQWVVDGNLVANNIPGNEIKPTTMVDLTTTEEEQRIADQIGADRQAVNYPYVHTGYDQSSSIKSFGDYYSELQNKISSIQPNNEYFSGEAGENMYMINGHTMLEAEVSLYNRLQKMTYGEAKAKNGHLIANSSTHLQNAVSPDMFAVATGFQKTGDHEWTFVNEFLGGHSLSSLNNSDITPIANKLQKDAVKSTIADIIKADRDKGQLVVDQNAVFQAEQNLANVQKTEAAKINVLASEDPTAAIKTQLAADLKKADSDYQTKLNIIKSNYDAAIKAATDKYNNKVTAAKKLAEIDPQADIDKINSQLEQKLNDLKTDRDQKVAAISQQAHDKVATAQAKHDANVKKITDEYQANVQKINTDTQAKIDQRAAELVALKKANAQKITDLQKQSQTSDHSNITIKTPDNKPAAKPETKPADKSVTKTDANQYGDAVQMKALNVTVNGQLPEPQFVNGFHKVVKTTDSMLVLSATDTVSLPEGTTASWVNTDAVKAHLANAGTYYEDVLVTFPDGSTTTVKEQLNVTATKTPEKPTPADPNANKPAQPTVPSTPSDNTNSNPTISSNVDNGTANNSNANVIAITNGAAANQIAGTNEYMRAEPMTREAYRAQQQAAVKNSSNAGQLPQTGNHQSLTALIAGGLAVGLSMFGLASKKRY